MSEHQNEIIVDLYKRDQCVLVQKLFIFDLALQSKNREILWEGPLSYFLQKVRGSRISHNKHVGQILVTDLRFLAQLFFNIALREMNI